MLQAGSPGAAAARAADKAQLQQQLNDKQQVKELSSLGSQSDLDRVQQLLAQRLAKLLQPPL